MRVMGGKSEGERTLLTPGEAAKAKGGRGVSAKSRGKPPRAGSRSMSVHRRHKAGVKNKGRKSCQRKAALTPAKPSGKKDANVR